MKLPKSVRDQFRRYGRQGGRTRAAHMSPESRQIVARKAAVQRWIRVRFGAASFEALGVPGGRAVDAGLAALAGNEESIESLMVALAAPRLKKEGVPVPRNVIADADLRLYRLLEEAGEGLAHARYLACLREVASFADACARVRTA